MFTSRFYLSVSISVVGLYSPVDQTSLLDSFWSFDTHPLCRWIEIQKLWHESHVLSETLVDAFITCHWHWSIADIVAVISNITKL